VDGVWGAGLDSGVGRGLTAMQQRVAPGLVIANNAYDGRYFPQVRGVMHEGWSAMDWKLKLLQEGAQKGMLFEAHAKCPPTLMNVAGFLVAAGEYSYFGCGPWYENKGGPYWFSEFYDRPLGKPHGPAVIKDKVWTRSFASGTIVRVDFNHQNASIIWGDGGVMIV